MTEQEAWDILNRYKELCKLYATAYQELAVHTRYSTVERVKACSLLEPYILDVLEQVDAALAIFCMENELRRLKGLEHFKIPVLIPHIHTIESNIQLQAYCQAVDDKVRQYSKKPTNLKKQDSWKNKERDNNHLSIQQQCRRAHTTTRQHLPRQTSKQGPPQPHPTCYNTPITKE